MKRIDSIEIVSDDSNVAIHVKPFRNIAYIVTLAIALTIILSADIAVIASALRSVADGASFALFFVWISIASFLIIGIGTELAWSAFGLETWTLSREDLKFERRFGSRIVRAARMSLPEELQYAGVVVRRMRRRGGTFVFREFVFESRTRKIRGWGRFSETDADAIDSVISKCFWLFEGNMPKTRQGQVSS